MPFPSTTEVPRLITGRLLLRELREDDFDSYAAMMADPLVTRYLGDGNPLAREGAAAALHYARTVLRRDPIFSIIRPANAGSIRVAESLGAAPDRAIDFFGSPARLCIYPRVAPPA
jgi:Acetyltransferases, including N-acetylases of ribosomal proteins